MKFRLLKANEIECRVKTVTQKGVMLLLYKNARCDMNILDETVGPLNWQRSHTRDNANCIVSIWDSDKAQWISKEDTGTESNTEKDKGLASDSFKRACFNWGIGRELYTAPMIWIPAGKCKVDAAQGGRGYTCSDRFYVSDVTYTEEGCIASLEIKNSKTNVICFEFGQKAIAPELASQAQIKTIASICNKHRVDLHMLYSSNNLTEENLTAEQAGQLLQSLKKKFGDV